MKNQKKWIAAILCTAAVGAGVFWAGSQGYIATASPNPPEFPSNLPVADPDQPHYKEEVEMAETPASETPDGVQAFSDQPEGTPTPAPTAIPAELATTKEEIYHRMLNSVDYFDAAKVCFDTESSKVDTPTTHYIETNLLTARSYETYTPMDAGATEIDQSKVDIEGISDGNYKYLFYRHNKTFSMDGYPSTRILEKDELVEDSPRAFSDGSTPYYVNRSDPTNAAFSGDSLFPQGFTFGFLTDFNLWDIDGMTEYLGRDCVEISGTANASYSAKMNVKTFSMVVDRATGILMKLEGLDKEGEPSCHIQVNSLVLDDPNTCAGLDELLPEYADYMEMEYSKRISKRSPSLFYSYNEPPPYLEEWEKVPMSFGELWLNQ